MIELTKVERENKVYVNDKAIILDKESITPSELLELAGFSSLVYDCYFAQNDEERTIEGEKQTKVKKKKKTTTHKPLDKNKKINIETGMRFNAVLKQ
ncbi:hypothetical protein [Candidatus Nitrosocosmicus franklandus]|uniref:Multi-ubiquitin domain-containing protein n=1 Tax=Candidatus Nitrosocosmicus franklandianus TaxID=1798806 RepID=A0A484I9G3_9ARCH|nr:hypothetical protein [Candidatus Nitrosocosmicus franklandus]VFJ14411.1 conserved protein of unknown function [Candidatus Nitrosocosmicus franklandus]